MRKFVPATDEVGRLQRGKDVVSRLFQTFAEKGHYGGRVKPSRTRQGIYAVTPSGEFLASCNTRSEAVVAKMMRKALARWQETPRTKRLLTKELNDAIAKTRRWEDRYPEDGLVLRITSRDLPGAREGWDWKKNAWNHDFAWFQKDEARQLLPAKLTKGESAPVPAKLARRLVQLHFLDHVRGQVSTFRSRDVRRAELQTKITAVDGDDVRIALTGNTHAAQRGRWSVAGYRDMHKPSEQERGMKLRLLGKAVWNTKQQRFTAFEAVAAGTRWGATQYNGRGGNKADLAAGPIGFVLKLGSGETEERTAPARIWNYGWK